MDSRRVELDGARRRVVFHGDCEQLRADCRALCCREWDVGITADEHASGRYEAEIVCLLTDKECNSEVEACIDRRYRLKRSEDGSCVYLEDDRCRIYAERPRTCREFTCSGGWRLASVTPPAEASPTALAPLTRESFVERLTDDLTFVPHPLLKVHTVFCLKQRGEVVFVKEMAGACGKFTTAESFEPPTFGDDGLMALIDRVAGKEPLGRI